MTRCGVGNDSVAAGLFGFVERFVCSFQQLLGGATVIGNGCRGAQTQCDHAAVFSVWNLQFFNLGAQMLGDVRHTLLVGVWEHDTKLLAAIATGQIVAPADCMSEHFGHFFQAGISGQVTIVVIEGLEVVDVGHDDRQWGEGSGTTRNLLAEMTIQQPTIRQAGEAIDLGLALEDGVYLLQILGDRDQFVAHAGDPLHRYELGLQDGLVHRLSQIVVPTRFDGCRDILRFGPCAEKDDRYNRFRLP